MNHDSSCASQQATTDTERKPEVKGERRHNPVPALRVSDEANKQVVRRGTKSLQVAAKLTRIVQCWGGGGLNVNLLDWLSYLNVY
jgi:hypothetical protein